MSDESATGSTEAPDRSRHSGRSGGEPTPLQSRAKFLQNWGWTSVAEINVGLCERGRAQRGINSETHAAVAKEWETRRATELTLLETFQFLQSCHRHAPFLFFNGNTFAEIGRAIATALFSDLPSTRRKEASSVVAHFITGVLREEMMIDVVNALSETSEWKPGDRVKTLRGTLRGKIVRVMKDGRVVWKPDRASNELIALPETLTRDEKLPKRQSA
ncbi:MAG TPA: hypothetical protein VHZ30_00335 [Verrucomicrobiae bacterium]|nr:hypothetical protein [Verrucomicrobiae bacterium]